MDAFKNRPYTFDGELAQYFGKDDRGYMQAYLRGLNIMEDQKDHMQVGLSMGLKYLGKFIRTRLERWGDSWHAVFAVLVKQDETFYTWDVETVDNAIMQEDGMGAPPPTINVSKDRFQGELHLQHIGIYDFGQVLAMKAGMAELRSKIAMIASAYVARAKNLVVDEIYATPPRILDYYANTGTLTDFRARLRKSLRRHFLALADPTGLTKILAEAKMIEAVTTMAVYDMFVMHIYAKTYFTTHSDYFFTNARSGEGTMKRITNGVPIDDFNIKIYTEVPAKLSVSKTDSETDRLRRTFIAPTMAAIDATDCGRYFAQSHQHFDVVNALTVQLPDQTKGGVWRPYGPNTKWMKDNECEAPSRAGPIWDSGRFDPNTPHGDYHPLMAEFLENINNGNVPAACDPYIFSAPTGEAILVRNVGDVDITHRPMENDVIHGLHFSNLAHEALEPDEIRAIGRLKRLSYELSKPSVGITDAYMAVFDAAIAALDTYTGFPDLNLVPVGNPRVIPQVASTPWGLGSIGGIHALSRLDPTGAFLPWANDIQTAKAGWQALERLVSWMMPIYPHCVAFTDPESMLPGWLSMSTSMDVKRIYALYHTISEFNYDQWVKWAEGGTVTIKGDGDAAEVFALTTGLAPGLLFDLNKMPKNIPEDKRLAISSFMTLFWTTELRAALDLPPGSDAIMVKMKNLHMVAAMLAREVRLRAAFASDTSQYLPKALIDKLSEGFDATLQYLKENHRHDDQIESDFKNKIGTSAFDLHREEARKRLAGQLDADNAFGIGTNTFLVFSMDKKPPVNYAAHTSIFSDKYHQTTDTALSLASAPFQSSISPKQGENVLEAAASKIKELAGVPLTHVSSALHKVGGIFTHPTSSGFFVNDHFVRRYLNVRSSAENDIARLGAMAFLFSKMCGDAMEKLVIKHLIPSSLSYQIFMLNARLDTHDSFLLESGGCQFMTLNTDLGLEQGYDVVSKKALFHASAMMGAQIIHPEKAIVLQSTSGAGYKGGMDVESAVRFQSNTTPGWFNWYNKGSLWVWDIGCCPRSQIADPYPLDAHFNKYLASMGNDAFDMPNPYRLPGYAYYAFIGGLDEWGRSNTFNLEEYRHHNVDFMLGLIGFIKHLQLYPQKEEHPGTGLFENYGPNLRGAMDGSTPFIIE